MKPFIHKLLGIVFIAGSMATQATSATSYTLVTEPAQGLTAIYNLVNSAQHTIDMTMYELSDTTFEQYLANQAAAGVTVRVILDINLEESNNQAAYTFLNANGVSCHWANTTYAATHQKTITIDSAYSNAQTAIMTLNLTPQYYSTSRDFAIIENDPNDIAAIETTFTADFNSSSITPPVGDDLVWSPTNSQTLMVGIINSAVHTLLVENEEMSDTAIVNALVSAAERGVNVQIMMQAGTSYESEWTKIIAQGGDVSTYAATAPLYIHAKVILADYGYSTESVFQGSENFSSASLTENRELGLIINNIPIMSSFFTTMTSDFLGGVAYTGSPANFTVSPSVATLSVADGSTGTVTITAAPFNSFKSAVAMTVSGLPTGVTAKFSPASISGGSGTSTLTFTASASAAAGSYMIAVIGTSGSLKNSTGVYLTVTAGSNPSFTLSASPASVNVQQGNSGTSTITSVASGGFSSAVALTASGLPSGVTASFNPSSISGGAGTSTLMLTASSSATVGTSTVTITGVGGSVTETTTVALTIASGSTPSFTLSASPASLSVQEGKTGTSTITSTISGGFSNAVALSASGLPSGVTASFNPASISGGAGTSTLTFTASSSATVGTSTITVTGSGGGVIATTSIALTITSGTTASFALSANPASLAVTQGSAGSTTITSTVSGGFSSAIALSATGLPSGVAASFNPTSITGAGTSTLMLTASSTAATGTSTVTVSGSGGGLVETTPVALTVNASGGGQLITDGGFESATKSGLTAPGWTATTNLSSHNIIIYDGSYPHSGKSYASLGAKDNADDTLTQTIAIPAGSTSTPLTFWVSIYTTETNGKAYDYLYVEIHNTSGTLLATELTLSNLNSTSDGNKEGAYFQPAAIDLSAYAGQTIELVFRGTNDYEDETTFLVDDVSVTAN